MEPTATPLPEPSPCPEPTPIDLLYVLDTSGSMEYLYAGPGTKLDAAKQAILTLNDWVAQQNNGSRVALVTFHGAGRGQDQPPTFPTDIQVASGFSADIGAFETPSGRSSGGGIQASGNYPGRPRTPDELRRDIEQALAMIPGNQRVNLHAIYGEFGGKRVDRDEIEPAHFAGWIGWARSHGLQLDFNATLFSHPLAASGFTLSSKDPAIRAFWIEHVQRCRQIAAQVGRQQGSPCIHNLWIPDGMKDACVDRKGYREILRASLDEIYQDAYDPWHMKDALESKLFGIGSESYVVGSHEFYLAYALSHGKIVCLDLGHFHPTESVADKISALLLFADELLLHVSRGVRWDSDHVVVWDAPVGEIAQEIVRANALERVHIALDFFDASLNRVGAYVIGARAMLQALLYALLEPRQRLVACEEAGDYFGRLALLEEMKAMPFGAVWDRYCRRQGVPAGTAWIEDVQRYGREVLSQRS